MYTYTLCAFVLSFDPLIFDVFILRTRSPLQSFCYGVYTLSRYRSLNIFHPKLIRAPIEVYTALIGLVLCRAADPIKPLSFLRRRPGPNTLLTSS